ncbi:MAG: hypothetical protein ACRBBP_07315 [Bdellovibrionales bacterium]
MKVLALTLMVLMPSIVFSSEKEFPISDFNISAVDLVETQEYTELFRPHVVLDEITYRFSGNRKTYEGLCKLIFSDREILRASPGFSAKGTAFLSSTGEIINLWKISRSFKFIKCYKDND